MRIVLANLRDGNAPSKGLTRVSMKLFGNRDLDTSAATVLSALRKRGLVYTRDYTTWSITQAGRDALADYERRIN